MIGGILIAAVSGCGFLVALDCCITEGSITLRYKIMEEDFHRGQEQKKKVTSTSTSQAQDYIQRVGSCILHFRSVALGSACGPVQGWRTTCLWPEPVQFEVTSHSPMNHGL